METISVNKQLLQEDRGTEKSDTELVRRQESRCKKYLRPTKHHTFECLLLVLKNITGPHLRLQAVKQHSSFKVPFPASKNRASVRLSFVPPSKPFFRAYLSGSFPTNRQRGSRHPKLQICARPLCILADWTAGFKTDAFQWSKSFHIPLKKRKKKKKESQQQQSYLHHFLLTTVMI